MCRHDASYSCANPPSSVRVLPSIVAPSPLKAAATGADHWCTMSAETTPLIRELDCRVSDGIEVRLLWRPHDEVVLVAVSDARTEESFAIEVREGENPLDVFHHPYAYAASRPKLEAIAS